MNGIQPQKKLICVGCDGTWCGETTGTLTNIQMLAESMAGRHLVPDDNGRADHDRRNGDVHVAGAYFQGLGLTGTFEDFIANGALADDIKQACVDAYTFIVNHYDEQSRIVLFGLSRGAYTVRSVAGMINNWGILDKSKLRLGASQEADSLLKVYAEAVYYNFRSPDPKYAPNSTYAEEFKREFSHGYPLFPPICFMGLLDTVGALGVPKLNAGINFSYEFYDTIISSEVEVCYQALAAHDRLSFFQPCFVRRADPVDKQNKRAGQASVKKAPSRKDDWPEPVTVEVWHPGAHYDIGHQRFVFPRVHIKLNSIGAYVESFIGFLNDKFNLLGLNVEPTPEYSRGVLRWMMLSMQKHVPGVFADDKIEASVARYYGNKPPRPGWFYVWPSHSKNAYDILAKAWLGGVKIILPFFRMALVDRNIPQYQPATFYSATGDPCPENFLHGVPPMANSRSGQMSRSFDTYDDLKSPKDLIWTAGP